MTSAEEPEVVSVVSTLVKLLQDADSMVGILKELRSLQKDMQEVAAGNPYAISRVPIEAAAASDAKYARALRKASDAKDPLIRLNAYFSILRQLRVAEKGLKTKELKLLNRLSSSNGTTDAENSAAKTLSRSVKDAVEAVRRKERFVLKRVTGAKRLVLEAVVRLDERLREMFPEGDAILREAVLKNTCAETVQLLALGEEILKKEKGI